MRVFSWLAWEARKLTETEQEAILRVVEQVRQRPPPLPCPCAIGLLRRALWCAPIRLPEMDRGKGSERTEEQRYVRAARPGRIRTARCSNQQVWASSGRHMGTRMGTRHRHGLRSRL